MPLTITNDNFQAGNAIVASEINTNFTELENYINNSMPSLGTASTFTALVTLNAGLTSTGGTTALSTTNITGQVNVGSDGVGHDVKFNGDSPSHWMLWDESEDALVVTSASAAIRLVDTHADSAPYIGFYDSSYNGDGTTGRLGYVGYPNNDDLYIRNSDADGHVFIMSSNKIEVSGALGTTYNSSIPRMAYNAGGAATLASHQMDANPTIFINPAANAPTATSTGDLWVAI